MRGRSLTSLTSQLCFVHGRVIFAGDSAHIVSPFGARGGNSGIQDIDNLVWKMAAVLKDEAGAGLIESYNEERVRGADENILNSARSTSFMTPKSKMEKIFRDAVLDLAGDLTFGRRLVNSGRLSLPCSLDGLSLQTPAGDAPASGLPPGLACPDAPLAGDDWLLNHLGGGFVLLTTGPAEPLDGVDPAIRQVAVSRTAAHQPGIAVLHDRTGHLTTRYGENRRYLIRPDQHIAARFGKADAGAVNAAWRRAMAN